jgi:hypothetical protein
MDTAIPRITRVLTGPATRHPRCWAMSCELRATSCLFALALLARLLVFMAIGGDGARFLYNDSPSYLRTAAGMSHGACSMSEGPPYVPSAIRTPVYPLFLAAASRLTRGNLAVMMLVQLTLAALLAPLTYRLARRWLAPVPASIVALVPALEPLSAIYSTAVMTEAVATLLLMMAVLAAVRAAGTGGVGQLILSGLLFAAVVLCRPLGCTLALLTALFLLASTRPAWRLGCARAALFLLAYGIGTAPWLIRNWQVMGSPVLCTLTGEHVLRCHAAEVVAATRGVSIHDARAQLLAEVAREEEVRGWGGAGVNQPSRELVHHAICMRRAKEIILEHPANFLSAKLRDLARLAIVPGFQSIRKIVQYDDYTRQRGLPWDRILLPGGSGFSGKRMLVLILAGLEVILLIILYAGCARAVAAAGRRVLGKSRSPSPGSRHPARGAELAYLLAIAASFYVLASHVGADPRYRLPAIPLLAIVAGYSWSSLRSSRRQSSHEVGFGDGRRPGD